MIKKLFQFLSTSLGLIMSKFTSKKIVEAFAKTFENHCNNDQSHTYHEICKGSLMVLAISELDENDFMYFCHLIGITEKIELESYINIGIQFEKLIEFSNDLPPDIEMLSALSFKSTKKIRKLIEMQLEEH